MYTITNWKDNARDPQNTYTMVQNADGTVKLTPAGTLVQQGTNQSAANFNNMEKGIFSANEIASEAVRMCRLLQRAVEGLKGEQIPVTLTNSLAYPFNNSKKTVSLTNPTNRNTKDYTVMVEVVSAVGGGVGDILITDKLLNGFKVEYTGAATSVSIICYVRGGM